MVSTRGGGGALGAMITVEDCAEAGTTAPPTARAANAGNASRVRFRTDMIVSFTDMIVSSDANHRNNQTIPGR
jgi:hypothetical protein